MTEQGDSLATVLNRDCYCIAVDREALNRNLRDQLVDAALSERLLDAPRNLFAASPVFLSHSHVEEMAALITAVESVARNPAYRENVLTAAPPITRQDFGPRGVFFSYDFHLGAAGPQLIEINTNAGGALLNLHLAASQKACCSEVTEFFGGTSNFAEAEAALVAMFQEEWRHQRGEAPLRRIAIVDNEPEAQFLYLEFLLFQSLFQRHGIEAVIAGPEAFDVRQGALWLGNDKVDLVYNRLTDFYFEAPGNSILATAYRDGLAVVTPSPHVYALFADKSNLTVLSDAGRLRDFGVEAAAIETISRSLPATVAVSPHNAEALWRDRKTLFFKPATGFGSRGAYRGAKLTHRVWADIVGADYIAQTVIPPSERSLMVEGEKLSLKLDLRCVTYNGEIQQLSARLYRGQTTNMRTEGGGLATVFATPKGL
ncbi:MAG: hypothetical protein ISR50_20395 [Alphaproteobacteria bacterium]|nr:hypothetical protein [Alphaproteobacteria bacterium]